ncbi:MAG: hypothetical protein FWG02_10520 [Holophagaceae bacterium]|nr:hypothetical protein [Holophagaceae bacterium]
MLETKGFTNPSSGQNKSAPPKKAVIDDKTTPIAQGEKGTIPTQQEAESWQNSQRGGIPMGAAAVLGAGAGVASVSIAKQAFADTPDAPGPESDTEPPPTEIDIETTPQEIDIEPPPTETHVDDEMSFGEAFSTARKEQGKEGIFTWRGREYNTYYKEEWDALHPQQSTVPDGIDGIGAEVIAETDEDGVIAETEDSDISDPDDEGGEVEAEADESGTLAELEFESEPESEQDEIQATEDDEGAIEATDETSEDGELVTEELGELQDPDPIVDPGIEPGDENLYLGSSQTDYMANHGLPDYSNSADISTLV